MESPSYHLIAKTPHYLVVCKDHGLPTVPLKKNIYEDSLLNQVATCFPEVLEGSHEGLVLHRLDTATSGLVLIARSMKVYSYFQEEQRMGRFIKTYHALTSKVECLPPGYPPHDVALESVEKYEITSSFRPYGKGRREVRPVTDESNHFHKKGSSSYLYTSHITHIGEKEHGHHLFKVSLDKGFRHQVRSHLCWSHYPILGDALYGGNSSSYLHLIASSIQFYDYEHIQLREYSLDLDETTLFEEPLYKEKHTL